MEFLKSILESAAQLEDAKFFESFNAEMDACYTACNQLVLEHDANMDDNTRHAVIECLMDDFFSDDTPTLRESISPEYQADIALLESATELSIVGVHDLIQESFEAAVQRILKSDRKLRMTSKDGKTKYKTRRRAAEAAAAASMAAVFGKKGVSRKAASGKRG